MSDVKMKIKIKIKMSDVRMSDAKHFTCMRITKNASVR